MKANLVRARGGQRRHVVTRPRHAQVHVEEELAALSTTTQPRASRQDVVGVFATCVLGPRVERADVHAPVRALRMAATTGAPSVRLGTATPSKTSMCSQSQARSTLRICYVRVFNTQLRESP